MKLWVDAQLSPAIAAWINRTFDDIEAESVRALGLRDATDPEIFEEAKKADAVVMSKDDDFIQLIEQRGTPPKLIWVTCGNTSNARMREILSTTLLTPTNHWSTLSCRPFGQNYHCSNDNFGFNEPI